ncbi:MAG: acetate--CoA ligase family protein [Burkholderiaceae bacterium]
MTQDIRTLGQGLDLLFRPRSIAIVGASADPTKTGGRPVSLLKKHGYPGAILPVNPKGGRIQDLPAYASVAALPEVPDLALIAVPGAGALEALEACAARGVRAAIVLSAGFAEQGDEGAARQRRLQEIVSRTGMRVLGPNCLGTVSVPERAIGTFSVALETDFPAAGPVAVLSQSGNVGSVAMKMLGLAGAGISRFMASGNEADIDIADGIAWAASDPATRVILCCMETCRSAPRLVAALDAARASGKPLFVLKIGTSEAGRAAALSHTGGLAGADRVFDAVFARHGAVRVPTLEALVQAGAAAAALGARRLPAVPSVVPVAASGGFGIMMADAAQAAGLPMNPVCAAAAARIRAVLPLAATANPVDATAQMSANPEVLAELLGALLDDTGHDVVCMMLALGLEVPRLRDIYMNTFRSLAAAYPDRCLMACVAKPAETIRELAQLGIACFPTIDALFSGIAIQARAANRGSGAEPSSPSAVGSANALDPLAFRNEFAAKRVLAQAGIPVIDERIATNAGEAAHVARELGGPLAMKILSPDIQHKTDIGGVMLGVAGPEAAVEAFEHIVGTVSLNAPEAGIDGVVMSRMVSGGVELIVGVSRDPLFGPMVMVGLGGIHAEIFRDTALRPAPVSHDEALAMLRSLKSFPLLDGARGRPRADIDAAARAIANLSTFAARHADDIAEIDINPLLVLPDGALALDALLVRASADTPEKST